MTPCVTIAAMYAAAPHNTLTPPCDYVLDGLGALLSCSTIHRRENIAILEAIVPQAVIAKLRNQNRKGELVDIFANSCASI